MTTGTERQVEYTNSAGQQVKGELVKRLRVRNNETGQVEDIDIRNAFFYGVSSLLATIEQQSEAINVLRDALEEIRGRTTKALEEDE